MAEREIWRKRFAGEGEDRVERERLNETLFFFFTYLYLFLISFNHFLPQFFYVFFAMSSVVWGVYGIGVYMYLFPLY